MEVQDNQRRLSFASVSGKQVEAVFDGGALTSDMGVMALREVASQTGILSRIVAALTDRRHPSYEDHTMADLASQPTMSRLENGIRRRDLVRMGKALVDAFIASYAPPPEGIPTCQYRVRQLRLRV